MGRLMICFDIIHVGFVCLVPLIRVSAHEYYKHVGSIFGYELNIPRLPRSHDHLNQVIEYHLSHALEN